MTPDGSIPARVLARAVDEGVVSADQAERLRALARNTVPTAETIEPADDESLRFVTGFADIFVTLGLVLFLGALGFFIGNGTGSSLMFAGLACAAWLLAEFFTGKRRMALPSIVLLLVFVAASFLVALQVFGTLLPAPRVLPERLWFVPVSNPAALAAAAILAAGLAAIHYVRFRVPITIAAGAAALCLLVLGLAASLLPGIDDTGVNLVLLGCGLAVFALAMRFDASDPERATRRADIAFWLHLLAAPLIVHPLVGAVLHAGGTRLTPGGAVATLAIFVALGTVAVIVDRRAILVSGLVYAGFAFGTLFEASGLVRGTVLLPSVLLALGAFILLLGAGWQPLRRALLRRLPPPLASRLPHPLVLTRS